ncbi:hypothetical protein VPHK30_0095 [Vibrio phage K30]
MNQELLTGIIIILVVTFAETRSLDTREGLLAGFATKNQKAWVKTNEQRI